MIRRVTLSYVILSYVILSLTKDERSTHDQYVYSSFFDYAQNDIPQNNTYSLSPSFPQTTPYIPYKEPVVL